MVVSDVVDDLLERLSEVDADLMICDVAVDEADEEEQVAFARRAAFERMMARSAIN